MMWMSQDQMSNHNKCVVTEPLPTACRLAEDEQGCHETRTLQYVSQDGTEPHHTKPIQQHNILRA